MAKRTRTAVDVSPDALLPALNLLPFATLGTKCGWYVNKKFKRAPSWAKASKAVPCLSCIADASMGRAVKHTSMRNGVKAWSFKNELALGEDQVDDLAYSLRAITAQLMNMKSQSRQIPRMWAPKFEAFYAKIVVEERHVALEAIEDEDEDESDDCEMITEEELPVDLVSIPDDSDSDAPDASKLFDSDDPVLRAILQRGDVRRRVPTKSPQSCFPVGPLDVTNAEMPKPAAENARDDEPMAKVEHQGRVKMEDGHDKIRQGVALGQKPGVALQHNDDDKMGKPTGSKGKKTHAQAMSLGCLGDLFPFNDDMPATKSTSMSSSGDDKLKGDAERPSKNSGQPKVVGTSSCPPDSEPSALHALQLLAKGISTGCALSPAAWAAVSKFKKEEAMGGTKKKKAAALKKAAMKKRKAAALKKAALKKAAIQKAKKVDPKCKAAMTRRKAASSAAASAVLEPAASAPIVATPTASASATDATAFATFIHREYSKTYHRIKTELMRGGFSNDDAAARGSDAARQHVADLRQQREEKLHS